jgi:hypothetical protein
VIVDDADPGFTILSGSWSHHFNSFFYGFGDQAINVPSAGMCQWRPSLPSGNYDVFAWWPSRVSPGRATYTIVTSNGNVSVNVDQSVPATWGMWNKLGTFPLTGSTALVQISCAGGQNVAADAVRFVGSSPPVLTKITVTPNPASVATGGTQAFRATATDQNGNPMSGITFTWTATGGTIDATGKYTAGSTAGTFQATAKSGSVSGSATINVTSPVPDAIVDDLDAGFTVDSGLWDVHYTPLRYLSTNRRIRPGTTGVCRFTPKLQQAGTYDVYAWWPSSSDATVAAVPYTVHGNNVTRTVAMDQTKSWGQWVLVGRFPLAPGSYITVTASSGVNAAADAVRCVFVGP